MADSIVTITIVEHEPPATVGGRLLVADPTRGVNACAEELSAIALGVRKGRVNVLVESSTGAAAAGTVAVTAADCTAGDTLVITIPGGEIYTMTAVATDAEVTAAPNAGYYSLETATDNAVGASIVTNANRMPGLSKWLLASGTGTVTFTSNFTGSTYNSIGIAKVVTTSSAFAITAMAGGADPGSAPSETCTLGGAALTADDTLTIGSVVLTWKASASGENQVTIGGDDATSLANLTAKINAHSKLQGLVLATDDAATVCTITWLGPPRAGELLYFAKSAANASAMVITGSGTFRSTPTEAYYAARKAWAGGVP